MMSINPPERTTRCGLGIALPGSRKWVTPRMEKLKRLPLAEAVTGFIGSLRGTYDGD